MSRATNEPEPLPEELKKPLGVADHILDPAAAVQNAVEDTKDAQITEPSSSSSENEEVVRSVSGV